MKKLIYLLIAALGFSCAEEEDMLVMYGPLIRVYRADARVVDQEGNPIAGIEVSVRENWEFTSVGYTDENGFCSVSLDEHPNINMFKFTDVDGEANGGEFINKSIKMSDARKADVEEDGILSIDVTLKKRE